MMQCWQWNAVHEGTRLCSVDNEMMLFMKAPTMQCWQWNDAIDEGTRQWHDAVLTMKWCAAVLTIKWCCPWGHRLCRVDNEIKLSTKAIGFAVLTIKWCIVDNEMMLFMNALDYAVLTMKWCSVDNVNQMKLSMKALTMQCWQWNDVVLTIKWCSGDNEMMMSMKALDDVVLTVKWCCTWRH